MIGEACTLIDCQVCKDPTQSLQRGGPSNSDKEICVNDCPARFVNLKNTTTPFECFKCDDPKADAAGFKLEINPVSLEEQCYCNNRKRRVIKSSNAVTTCEECPISVQLLQIDKTTCDTSCYDGTGTRGKPSTNLYCEKCIDFCNLSINTLGKVCDILTHGCTTCSPGYFLTLDANDNNRICVIKCPPTQYGELGLCKNCQADCKSLKK